MTRSLIAVFSGPEATIQNSPELVTSDKARRRMGLAPAGGRARRYDALRAQRLAAPATVYVEQFSAHPLEADASELFGAPDGYLGAEGVVKPERTSADDRPVFAVELSPEDGLYLLPYMGFRADGHPWDSSAGARDGVPRPQSFYPDASRIYEEIDRFGLDDFGRSCLLSDLADFEFHRAAPSGGYEHDPDRGEVGEEDFFPYTHQHPTADPSLAALARATNVVQATMASGRYAGAQWLEGSPTIEESLYWLNLLVDTTVPIVGHAAQRRRQTIGSDADRNILDGVRYLTSGTWAGADGTDAVGCVVIVDGLAFSAREIAKTAARPGNYVGSGPAGAVLAVVDGQGPPEVVRLPVRRHTHASDVRLTVLPDAVPGVRLADDGTIETFRVPVKDEVGDLLGTAVPRVVIEKIGFYHQGFTEESAGIRATVAALLRQGRLGGIVVEGRNPYGTVDRETAAAMTEAVHRGIPVVITGRGTTAARVSQRYPTAIAASDLTSTKARILLMAAMLKLGSLPPAADPAHPTAEETAAIRVELDRFQAIFDTH